MALERCIARGMGKLESVQLLARLGVPAKFAVIGKPRDVAYGSTAQLAAPRRQPASPAQPSRPAPPAPRPPLACRLCHVWLGVGAASAREAFTPPGASSAGRPALNPTPYHPPVAAVWERLEAENPEFFAAYNAQLQATAQMERCHL